MLACQARLLYVHIYKEINSEFIFYQEIGVSSRIKGMKLSNDDKYLFLALVSGDLEIFHDNGTQFLHFQSINDTVMALTTISLTSDMQLLAIGGFHDKVRIFKL